MNYVEDTVWLRTTIYNECAPQGITQRYWFICSFYGIEDYGSSTCTGSFNVVPNPNNGTMTLNFESFTGKVEMKVYDMTGHLVDQFETYNAESSSMTYSMKGRADGIYFFVATSKDGTIAKKVIVSQ